LIKKRLLCHYYKNNILYAIMSSFSDKWGLLKPALYHGSFS
jgi:hypothetical protein